jgi:psp operon transcriptional activator
LRNVVERAVYRWGDAHAPVDEIQFDPFESPWVPIPLQQNSSTQQMLVPQQPMLEIRSPSPFDPGSCADFRLAIAEYEKAILAAALDKCRWNQRAAAAALQLSYDQLRHALKRHDLLTAEAKAG